MMKRLFFLVPVIALAACGGSGSSSASRPGKAPVKEQPKEGPVVARVGDRVITAGEVEEKLSQQAPFMQARYRDLKYRAEFVESLVRAELLALEAERLGYAERPAVRESIKKILVQEFIRDSFDESGANYSEEELRAYYDKLKDEFVKPERVRASHIFLAADPADPQKRAAQKKKAGELLTRLKENAQRAPLQHPKHSEYKPSLFADLASEHSDDLASRPRKGDLAYLSREDLARNWSSELAEAVFALRTPNELSDVVETPKGFHIASFMGRMNAVNRPYDSAGVRETLKGKLFRDERTRAFDENVEKLRKSYNVSIDEDVLAAIEVPGQLQPAGLPPPKSAPRLNPAPSIPITDAHEGHQH